MASRFQYQRKKAKKKKKREEKKGKGKRSVSLCRCLCCLYRWWSVRSVHQGIPRTRVVFAYTAQLYAHLVWLSPPVISSFLDICIVLFPWGILVLNPASHAWLGTRNTLSLSLPFFTLAFGLSTRIANDQENDTRVNFRNYRGLSESFSGRSFQEDRQFCRVYNLFLHFKRHGKYWDRCLFKRYNNYWERRLFKMYNNCFILNENVKSRMEKDFKLVNIMKFVKRI